MSEVHEKYMQRCFQLALLGRGNVSPNPMVGCVIVHNDKIIGEGYHQVYGGAHAEVNAINNVENKDLLKESVVYVNLEPCSHYGKTPPCADLLIKHQLKKVVIANKDPNPLVNGKGIQMLKSAGIEVVIDVLQEEGIVLNKVFFTHKIQQRPYIVLKWAQSADGFMGKENERVTISGEVAQLYSHKLRYTYDAIMVGTKTAIVDNPKLTDRFWNGRQPLRIIIDKNLTVPQSNHLLDKSCPTIIYNLQKEEHTDINLSYVKLEGEDDLIFKIIDSLNSKEIASLVVEGGAVTLQKFIDLDIWDEINIIQSKNNLIHFGIRSPVFRGIVEQNLDLDKDIVSIYKPISQ
jgi:diaminohydroxyphosphoribosylaminopyrimidine deaminase/5-amino-6-(5-phosphoribosylamino)uracil reductase